MENAFSLLEDLCPAEEDLLFEIEFPSDDESLGNVAVAWRLPEPISRNIEMLEAYKLVLKYLTATQVTVE